MLVFIGGFKYLYVSFSIVFSARPVFFLMIFETTKYTGIQTYELQLLDGLTDITYSMLREQNAKLTCLVDVLYCIESPCKHVFVRRNTHLILCLS